MIQRFTFLSLILISFSCRTEQKFDKAKWAEVADLMTFPNRKYMINDLVETYQLKGKKYKEIIELLGQPQSKLDSSLNILYDVDIDYGSDRPGIFKNINVTI